MNSYAGVRVGIVGVSWWAHAMYLPSLAHHPIGRVTALCGRDMDRTRTAADRWGVAYAFDNWRTMLDSGQIDAVIVASTNETHYDITMAALEQGLPVLCEKPIALTAEEATRMAAAAAKAGVVTMVPFTYRYMPTNQYIKHLIDDGYIGQPYSLNMRYFTGFARDSAYSWRFDTEKAGSGIIGDLGTHWLDMARWFLGEVTSISASVEHFVPRAPRPDGSGYNQAEDSALISARFASGATASLQTSAVCWEGAGFGQVHALDLHGSDGTLHAYNDWDRRQELTGLKSGEPGPAAALTIPEEFWRGSPRDVVHDTYRHIFRRTEAMTRDWVSAIAVGRTVEPDLATGARIQQLVAAAVASVADNGRWQSTPISSPRSTP